MNHLPKLFILFSAMLVTGICSIAADRKEKLDSPENHAASAIDASYQKLWAEKKITPAPISSDSEFVRRVYLDITGRTPTARQVTTFLESTAGDKRAQLVERLVNSSEFAEYFASRWTALFLGYKNDQYVNRMQFQKWLAEGLVRNAGWDGITNEIITASGTLTESPALNWYAHHRLDAANLADDTSRLFLGIQLGCARCHHHPHEKWKLEDFYGLAAFYNGLKRDELTWTEKRQRRELKQQREEMMEKYKTADTAVRNERTTVMKMREDFRGLLRLAQDRSDSITAEIKGKDQVYRAKFLLEPQPAHVTENQRKQLSAWITSPTNPFFAAAFVNRVWGMLMGKGFVHPVDDMGGLNTASNAELLNFLAEDFKKNNYNIQHLFRSIANSRTYQLSSQTKIADPPEYYERGKVQMLNPDQLLNSLFVATSIETAIKMRFQEQFEERKQSMYLQHVFLFDNDDSSPVVEFEGTIPQALLLLNGRITNEAIQPAVKSTMSRIASRKNMDVEKKINFLFLQTLSRPATPKEIQELQTNIPQKGETVSAYEDIFWALLNSNEFLFNH